MTAYTLKEYYDGVGLHQKAPLFKDKEKAEEFAIWSNSEMIELNLDFIDDVNYEKYYSVEFSYRFRMTFPMLLPLISISKTNDYIISKTNKFSHTTYHNCECNLELMDDIYVPVNDEDELKYYQNQLKLISSFNNPKVYKRITGRRYFSADTYKGDEWAKLIYTDYCYKLADEVHLWEKNGLTESQINVILNNCLLGIPNENINIDLTVERN